MYSVSLTGSDTIKIDDRILADLADSDAATLTYVNELTAVKTGKNRNSIYALNETGHQADLVIRVLRGSADDKYLLNRLNNMSQDFARFVLITGEFVKNVGDGAGNITSDTYLTSGGTFLRKVDAKSSAEGDTEQSVSIYTIRFANSDRTLG
ncbi:hypothetical protein AAIR98_000907 [Elusimicrobium simillimum]|uniref:hypothetical protein n=1 Tax=Elusimicrobium simillimum TaxID=3143438 RepID=UPI003C702731